jgi:hypothetical protein
MHLSHLFGFCYFISYIYLKLNNIRESGWYAPDKLCVFNDKIKLIEWDTFILITYFLDYMIQDMGANNNYSNMRNKKCLLLLTWLKINICKFPLTIFMAIIISFLSIANLYFL